MSKLKGLALATAIVSAFALAPPATTAATVRLLPCPSDTTALAKVLSGHRVLTSREEVASVQASPSFTLVGDAGENHYDPAGFTILGVRPNSVEAGFTEGEPLDFAAMLPGHVATAYEAAFRAAFPGKGTSCDENGCSWQPRNDTWNAPEGTLIEARTSLTALSATETRFRCSYR